MNDEDGLFFETLKKTVANCEDDDLSSMGLFYPEEWTQADKDAYKKDGSCPRPTKEENIKRADSSEEY